MIRRTKIVCTIGPATSDASQIAQLIAAGMDVARLNFSHGVQADHARVIDALRAESVRSGKPIAILQDLQGPKIRTGALQGHQSVELMDGATFAITTTMLDGDATRVSTTYQHLVEDVRPGDRILISDGLIELRVVNAAGNEVTTTVIHGGTLNEHQGINLPGVAVSAPALTEKDREDLAFGVAQGVDYIALSFVRRPEDLDVARAAVRDAQMTLGMPETPIPLIAKLEKPEAIEHLDDILARSDGVMVARGDLGVELPLEEVPMIQKRIIRRANALGLPVITATQMLESMIIHPRPTRAEVSDIANAILDGTDALMLSGETAAGRFPIEAVRVMARVAVETEDHNRIMRPVLAEHPTTAHAISLAARTLSEQAAVKLIIVFTRSGASAQLIARDRPNVPILALTPSVACQRRLTLWWGVHPYQTDLMPTTESLITWADRFVQAQGMAQRGDLVVIMGGMPVARQAVTNFVKLHVVSEGS